MSGRKGVTGILLVLAFGCAAMALVDGVWQPPYAVKSAVKVVLFLLLPVLYSVFDKGIELKRLFVADKKGLKFAFLLSIPLYALILGAYLLFKDVFDFSAVTGALTGNAGVTRENFLYVAIYISFVNSLLEEFFFRGFGFLSLRGKVPEWAAYIISAAAFALYHIAIMTGWFSVGVFVLLMAGLFAGGLIFNFLNARFGNIYTSWLVHMAANFAINTVGMLLFGII